jgi:hypothetical protein
MTISLALLELWRHIKIRGAANPYDPQHTDYFRMRRGDEPSSLSLTERVPETKPQ